MDNKRPQNINHCVVTVCGDSDVVDDDGDDGATLLARTCVVTV